MDMKIVTLSLLALVLSCGDPTGSGDKALPRPLDPVLVEQGREIFRPANTIALLKLNPIRGLHGTVEKCSRRPTWWHTWEHSEG